MHRKMVKVSWYNGRSVHRIVLNFVGMMNYAKTQQLTNIQQNLRLDSVSSSISTSTYGVRCWSRNAPRGTRGCYYINQIVKMPFVENLDNYIPLQKGNEVLVQLNLIKKMCEVSDIFNKFQHKMQKNYHKPPPRKLKKIMAKQLIMFYSLHCIIND